MTFQTDIVLERILETIKNKGIKEKELLLATNLNTSFLTDWKKGRIKSPSLDKIIKIANYLNLSLDWLTCRNHTTSLSADEMKIIKSYRSIPEENKEAIQLLLNLYIKQNLINNNIIKEETKNVNYYLNAVSAGTGQFLFDDSVTDILSIPNIKKYKNVDYAVRVSGESMEPKFFNNDILLVQSTSHLNIGEIGIFYVDGDTYVKELGVNQLISVNPEFNNIRLTENSRCLGRVIDSLRPNFFKC